MQPVYNTKVHTVVKIELTLIGLGPVENNKISPKLNNTNAQMRLNVLVDWFDLF